MVRGCRLARGSRRRAPYGGWCGRAGALAAAAGMAGAVGGGAPHRPIYQPGRREGGGFALTPQRSAHHPQRDAAPTPPPSSKSALLVCSFIKG